jgi:hypothetical protein
MVDTIKYKCGHMFHKYCLLPKTISILNPECKVCNNGKMEGYPSDKEEVVEEEDDDNYDDDDKYKIFDEEEDDNYDDDDKYKIFDEEDLNKHEKIILYECILLGLSLIGVITGLIYR